MAMQYEVKSHRCRYCDYSLPGLYRVAPGTYKSRSLIDLFESLLANQCVFSLLRD